jgi:di/tricarboxylate transporter
MSSVYPGGAPDLSVNAKKGIVGAVALASFLAMAMELASPDITFIVGLVVVMLAGVLTMNETLSGFSNDSVITVGCLFLVVRAVEKSHIVDHACRKLFGVGQKGLSGNFRLLGTCFLLSSFVSNFNEVLSPFLLPLIIICFVCSFTRFVCTYVIACSYVFACACMCALCRHLS